MQNILQEIADLSRKYLQEGGSLQDILEAAQAASSHVEVPLRHACFTEDLAQLAAAQEAGQRLEVLFADEELFLELAKQQKLATLRQIFCYLRDTGCPKPAYLENRTAFAEVFEKLLKSSVAPLATVQYFRESAWKDLGFQANMLFRDDLWTLSTAVGCCSLEVFKYLFLSQIQKQQTKRQLHSLAFFEQAVFSALQSRNPVGLENLRFLLEDAWKALRKPEKLDLLAKQGQYLQSALLSGSREVLEYLFTNARATDRFGRPFRLADVEFRSFSRRTMLSLAAPDERPTLNAAFIRLIELSAATPQNALQLSNTEFEAVVAAAVDAASPELFFYLLQNRSSISKNAVGSIDFTVHFRDTGPAETSPELLQKIIAEVLQPTQQTHFRGAEVLFAHPLGTLFRQAASEATDMKQLVFLIQSLGKLKVHADRLQLPFQQQVVVDNLEELLLALAKKNAVAACKACLMHLKTADIFDTISDVKKLLSPAFFVQLFGTTAKLETLQYFVEDAWTIFSETEHVALDDVKLIGAAASHSDSSRLHYLSSRLTNYGAPKTLLIGLSARDCQLSVTQKDNHELGLFLLERSAEELLYLAQKLIECSAVQAATIMNNGPLRLLALLLFSVYRPDVTKEDFIPIVRQCTTPQLSATGFLLLQLGIERQHWKTYLLNPALEAACKAGFIQTQQDLEKFTASSSALLKQKSGRL